MNADWRELWEVFLESTSNSLPELTLFVTGLISVLVLNAWLKQRRVKKIRSQIPLVLGGWGTRGKSGTERKKAALLNALGARVVSKTTGCEALLILASDLEQGEEVPLFRPHDKATIWEQVDVLERAVGLSADVMLWECMGLQPEYVRILQDSWMRDDLSTLTNAYPDHEDLQGPAGRDVAVSISTFVTQGGRVFTSEVSMRPVLAERARERGAEFLGLDADDADLICPDVLESFPYRVHPRNLLLCARVGEELGLDRDFVYQGVAEYLVPDLGVLKTYPGGEATIGVAGRRLRFTNSMSANERAGTLFNWDRLGLSDLDQSRQEWVVLVINNRADRIPRSKVFADLIVNDLGAHRCLLIGTNLEGLETYISESLERRLDRLTIPSDPERVEGWARGVLARDAAYLRALARTPSELAEHCAPLLGSASDAVARVLSELDPGATSEVLSKELQERLSPVVEEGQSFFRAALEGFCGLRSHAQALEEALAPAASAERLSSWLSRHREWYREAFLATVQVIPDPSTPGVETIRRCAGQAPPQTSVHVIGMQNIKGTGLDFANRWVALGRTHRLLQELGGFDLQAHEAAARSLRQLKQLSDFEHEEVCARLRALVNDGTLLAVQRREAQRLLELFHERSAGAEGGGGSAKPRSALTLRLLAWLELPLDTISSVMRTRRVKRVARELMAERISTPRAIELLEKDVKAQKPGWLIRWLDGR